MRKDTNQKSIVIRRHQKPFQTTLTCGSFKIDESFTLTRDISHKQNFFCFEFYLNTHETENSLKTIQGRLFTVRPTE